MKVFISGFGTVGQGIMELVTMKSIELDAMLKEPIQIVGVMDSKSYILKEDGLCSLCVLGRKKSQGRCL